MGSTHYPHAPPPALPSPPRTLAVQSLYHHPAWHRSPPPIAGTPVVLRRVLTRVQTKKGPTRNSRKPLSCKHAEGRIRTATGFLPLPPQYCEIGFTQPLEQQRINQHTESYEGIHPFHCVRTIPLYGGVSAENFTNLSQF